MNKGVILALVAFILLSWGAVGVYIYNMNTPPTTPETPVIQPLPTPTPPPVVIGPPPKPPSDMQRGLTATHYWDCNGQGCDARTLQPWDESKYVSSYKYAPTVVHPKDSVYGEKMWLTGAASDFLSDKMMEHDPTPETCCGISGGDDKACGKCMLIRVPESNHPDWTAVVMKKNRCPPWSNSCQQPKANIDIAVPGFDNLQYSTANVCGQRQGTMRQDQSTVLGDWYKHGKMADQKYKCDKLPKEYRDGCKIFTEWGWYSGNPQNVEWKVVDCPKKFKDKIKGAFGPKGPI